MSLDVFAVDVKRLESLISNPKIMFCIKCKNEPPAGIENG